MQQRDFSRSWLRCSVCSLVWGWNPNESWALAPIRVQKKQEENWGPGRRWLPEADYAGRNTWRNNSSAVSLEGGNFSSTVKCTNFNLSPTVRTAVIPLESGKPVTKSNTTCDQGRGTERGWRWTLSPLSPLPLLHNRFPWLEAFPRAHSGHAAMKSSMSDFGPPELTLEESQGAVGPRMAGEKWGMGPLQDLRVYAFSHEEPVGGCVSRSGTPLECLQLMVWW